MKVNRNLALFIARFFKSRFFNQELIIKSMIDLKVDKNSLTAKDLLVDTASVIPFI